MKVLLVDDDAIIRTGMRRMICKDMDEGHVIEEFSNGQDALDFVKGTGDVDLVITDVRMPLMDGLQLIEEAHKIDEDIKFIVLSGFDEFSYARRAFREGAVDYLLKPLNREEFISRVVKVEEDIKTKNKDKENKKIHREVLLSDKLRQVFRKEPDAVEELRQCLDMSKVSSYFAVVIELGVYYRNNIIQQDLQSDVSKMKHIFIDKIEAAGYSLILYSEENTIYSVLFAEEEKDERAICNLLNDILEGAKEDFLLSIGMSNRHVSFEDMTGGCQEAAEAAQFKFYMGNNRVYQYGDIEGKSLDFEYDIMPLVDKLVQEIELMDYPRARDSINQFFVDISFMKPQKIRACIKDLLYLLVLQVQDFEKALSYNGCDYNWLIKNVGTYNEMKDVILSLMKNGIQYMCQEKQKKQTQRVEVAKKYLNEHYMEVLSLNDVAAYVELNPSYFS